MLLPLNLASITLAFGIIAQSKEKPTGRGQHCHLLGGTVEKGGGGGGGGLAFVDQKAICAWISKDREVCLKSTSQVEDLQA